MGLKRKLDEYRKKKADGTFKSEEEEQRELKRGLEEEQKQLQEKKKKYVYIKEMTWVDILLRLGLYAVLQYLFYNFGFGVPFFMVSLLVGMYLSTSVRWKRRKAGELSAYSVFNPSFEKLPGEMDGEKMARQYAGGGLVMG
eukprot:m.17253 g.17253  ORF g.17253 m.17253 type:complete len:141 (+) comp4752_c0_seq1:205-627(+)